LYFSLSESATAETYPRRQRGGVWWQVLCREWRWSRGWRRSSRFESPIVDVVYQLAILCFKTRLMSKHLVASPISFMLRPTSLQTRTLSSSEQQHLQVLNICSTVGHRYFRFAATTIYPTIFSVNWTRFINSSILKCVFKACQYYFHVSFVQ